MSGPDAIAERIDRALRRIEAVAEAGSGSDPADAEATARAAAEIENLKAERDGLRRDLEAIRAENDSLRRLTDTVSGRLDEAIDELEAALGS